MLEPNPSIDVTHRDSAAVLTLNRPERYNAITIPMMQRLLAALDEAGEDNAIRSVIITATGKGFCAGQDLKVLSKFYEHHDRGELGGWLRDHYNAVIERIWSLEKPVIAAIQGVAAGAGWSLALACDLRIAAQSARMVPGFAKLGLIPDLGGTATLIQAVGYAKAFEFALLTESLTADQALTYGLLNHVAPDDALMSTALAWSERLAQLPATGVGLTKRALRAAAGAVDETLAREAHLQAVAASAPEHLAHLRTFVAGKS